MCLQTAAQPVQNVMCFAPYLFGRVLRLLRGHVDTTDRCSISFDPEPSDKYEATKTTGVAGQPVSHETVLRETGGLNRAICWVSQHRGSLAVANPQKPWYHDHQWY